MQRYEDDGVPARPNVQRRNTLPAQMAAQVPPVPMTFTGHRAGVPVAAPPISNVPPGPSYPAQYYPDEPAQMVPMGYHPQFMNMYPQPGMRERSFLGMPMEPIQDVPMSSMISGAMEAPQLESQWYTSVDSGGYSSSESRLHDRYYRSSRRSRSRPRSRPRGYRPPSVTIYNERDPERGRASTYSSPSTPSSSNSPMRRRRVEESYIRPGGMNLEDAPHPDELGASTVYSFTPSRISRAAMTQTGKHGDDEPLTKEVEDIKNNSNGGVRKELGRTLALSCVFRSQYTGDHTLGGSHSVKLTAVSSSRFKFQPLFRWLHCTRNLMDFDDFSNEAMRIPDLTNAEQTGIRDLLNRVQRKFVRFVQSVNGNRVRYMEPACIQHVLPRDGNSNALSFSRRTVTWVCLPYFSLEKYCGLQGAAENPSAIPIQTLLQTRFPRVSKDRDMCQVVCESSDTPTEFCFHVAQIWCLVLDNSFLFTYSRMTDKALRGDSIDLSVQPIQEISDRRQRAIIIVSYKQAIWSIPVAECQTWLEFLLHFHEFWPRPLQFFRRKQPVTADDWERIWHTAQHVDDDNIMLEMRIRAAPEPPPAGILIPKNIDREDEEEDSPSVVQPVQATPEKPLRRRKGRTMSGNSNSTAKSTLSIFSCLVDVTTTTSDTIDEQALVEHLLEVEDYIRFRTRFGDSRAYKTCPEATRDGIYAELEKAGIELSNLEGQRGRQQDYEMQLDIFNAADVVFGFFFPADVDVPTIGKFWGALSIIVTGDGETVSNDESTSRRPRHKISKHTMRNIRSNLRSLCVELQVFQEMFDRSGIQERAKIAVPKEIVQGWIHLLMALIHLPKKHEKSHRLLDDARFLIHSGMAIVVRSLSKNSLLDKSIVLPLELLSLLSLKLLQDVTVRMPDISECYATSLHTIEADITQKPSDRSREHRIGLVMEEISAAQSVINAQKFVFQSLLDFARVPVDGERPAALDRLPRINYVSPEYLVDSRQRSASYYSDRARSSRPPMHQEVPVDLNASYGSRTRSRGRYDGDEYPVDYAPIFLASNLQTDFKLPSTDPDGYRVLLLQECLRFLAERQRNFSDFRAWASSLERANRHKIDTTKDRHDNAIYAFTIVTIIFLPLSAVASIFGMNTSDVRDMDLSQSVYWATAVPVTAIVIFLGLLWTGELGNIMRWIQSFGQRRLGYQALSDNLYHDDYELRRRQERLAVEREFIY